MNEEFLQRQIFHDIQHEQLDQSDPFNEMQKH